MFVTLEGEGMSGFSTKAKCRKRLQECITKMTGVETAPVTNMVLNRADCRKLFDMKEDLKKMIAKLR